MDGKCKCKVSTDVHVQSKLLTKFWNVFVSKLILMLITLSIKTAKKKSAATTTTTTKL